MQKILLVEKKKRINHCLDSLIPEPLGPHATLYQAARYALQTPGKRLRPILTLTTVEMLKGDLDLALEAACAIEMLHTYSLIHDDLPCMDDDDFRRGQPSLHKAFPEGIAVLTGDYLLTHAFQLLSNSKKLSIKQKVDLINVLTRCAGGEGMIAGQVIDLESENREISYDLLQVMHRKKTALLFSCAIEFGGILCDSDLKTLQILRGFGETLGLAFQIIDDFLDKSVKTNSDLVNRKATYVSHLGIERAKEMALKLTEEAIDWLKQLPYDTLPLQAFANSLCKRNI